MGPRAQLRRFDVTLAACRYRKRITLAFKRHVITIRRINGIWSIFNFLWQVHIHAHNERTLIRMHAIFP